MKTKLEMAHEFMLAMIKAGCSDGPQLLECAWQYADAMQAEADKRSKKHHDFVPAIMEGIKNAELEEWQPDWSQAPEWANCWQKSPPDYKQFDYFWFCEVFKDGKAVGNKKEEAPSFGYTGDWRNSLRKRPQ